MSASAWRPNAETGERVNFRTDCRHFRGHVPCAPHKAHGHHCDGCPEFRARAGRILLIKLGAAGDVIRTTPLLEPLRREYPDHVLTWVTEFPALLPTVVDTILRNNKGVKRCFQYEYKRSGSVPRSLPVGFKVRSSGSVSSAWVNADSFKGSELESCLKGAILAVQFPPFEGDTKTMSYTFRL